MIESFVDILNHSIIITSFVFTMMLLIEYINVMTRGNWQKKLSESKYGQYFLGVFLGAVPGCLGAFTVVSLYSHNVVSFGALVATMIATSGDEAYVMLSMFPGKAIWLFIIIGIVGFSFGIFTDLFIKKFKLLPKVGTHGFDVHEEEYCPCFPGKEIFKHLKEMSFPRALLIGILGFLLILLLTNVAEPHEWNWIKITLLITTIFALFVVFTVPDHFLEDHLWKHVLKKHLLRIFLWTFGALLIIHTLESFINLEAWIETNLFMVLIIALLIGIIPESGPNLIFITLFASGTIPFSILIANSIVQDGHGTLPLLAVSRKSFILLKIVNVIAGLLVGVLGLFLNF